MPRPKRKKAEPKKETIVIYDDVEPNIKEKRLDFHSDKSHKYYNIFLKKAGNTFNVEMYHGKILKDGKHQTKFDNTIQIKSFDTLELATNYFNRKLQSKLDKGYIDTKNLCLLDKSRPIEKKQINVIDSRFSKIKF